MIASARGMWAVAAVVLALDQLTKFWIVSVFRLHESMKVIPGLFNLTYVRNTGAAWGMFKAYPGALTMLAASALVILLAFPRYFQGSGAWPRWGWALLAAGISGNLIDRIRLGSVTDFLDFYVGRSHWPAFNIADSAICAGVLCYVIDSLFRKERPEAPVPAGAEGDRRTD